MSDEYKSLRTVIFEVQAATAPKPPAPATQQKPDPTAAKPSRHKPGEVWKTASGRFGAMNKDGEKDYGFDDEKKAKAWAMGTGPSSGADQSKLDTSQQVELDKDGYEATSGETPSNAKPAAAGEKPAAPQSAGGAAPKAQTATPDTQRTAQPQGSQKGAEQKPAQAQPEVQHAEVGRENPKSEYDVEIKPDEKATADAKAKKDIRKANIVAGAIKNGEFSGPQNTKDSVFGKPEEERRFVEEMNHAALSAMRGETGYEFELCSKAFAQLGFCFDPETGEKVSKGIPRISMPQFSSKINPERKDSTAFKALMAAKGYTSPDQVTEKDLGEEVNLEKQYRAALEDAGYTIEDQEVSVTDLKPIQGQLQGSKVVGMYGTLLAAQSDPDTYGKAAARLLDPIYVSDGYVIDGHHRWAAQCAVDVANGAGANTTMRTRTITKNGKPVPIDEIIAFSNKFQKDNGLLSQTNTGQTVPEPKKSEAKPQPQKEWNMSKFGSKRMQNIVESLNEAVKTKYKKPKIVGDEPDTFGGAPLEKSKPSIGGKMGYKPISLAQQVTNDAAALIARKKGENTAADLIATIEKKPDGTTFEIYGKKNGKEYTLKVKKVYRMGASVYETVSGRPVVFNISGVGLQVLDKRTRKIVLDRGNDLIWESADLSDCGKISITEIRKLTKDELKAIRPGIKKPAPKK